MKKYKIGVVVAFLLTGVTVFAGNEDRAGEAGASELLINPWGRSSGWGGANTASVTGVEAMNLNVAGLAYTNNTEINFTNTSWLGGSDISINAFGFAKKMGESGGVLGLSIMSMSFGELDITTVENPDGGLGTFKPNYLNIGAAYSKNFSNTISGGLVVKLITESISNASASGFALDAGVNYVTGDNDRLKFGIALRNVGPTVNYSGNGLSTRMNVQNSEKELTVSQRSNDFELPSLVNIGLSYDFYLMVDSTESETPSEHRLTAAANFTSNSFTSDQLRIGAEYAFREMFMLRAGYILEDNVSDEELTRTTSTGPTFGATIEVPFGKSGTKLGIDYSYRVTRTFGGTNAVGLKLSF
ncbi:MAG: DUF3308 domain-containing protein [Bacteroidetes bacterium]|nr:MAG: DUF3308 domain-containing protein [Bacteroidota bacterium]MBL1143865.1 DUF3308 domain-containing protein [Bacteroidota bacterium]MCB0801525.1 PorV/PorQ family protein [Flavobacteriales bacterium]NOG56666.1 PorV/PorQ family protein [Bacteroidota bacterium]